MRQCTNGVVIEIQSGHCTSCDSPSTSVLCANRFQMGLEEVECIPWGSGSNHLSRLFYELVEVNYWLRWRRLGGRCRFRGGIRNGLGIRNNGGWCRRLDHGFWFVMKQCWLALKCHFHDFGSSNNFCSRHQFTELKVFISVIMVDGFCKDSFSVSCAGFFHDLLDLCFAESLSRFVDRHFFNFHRFTASLAPSLQFSKRRVTWEEHKRP